MRTASPIVPWITAATLWPVVPWPSKAWITGSSPAARIWATICFAAFSSPGVPVSRPSKASPARARASFSRSCAVAVNDIPRSAATVHPIVFISFPRLSFALAVPRLARGRDLAVQLRQQHLDRLLQRRVPARDQVLVGLRYAEVRRHPISLQVPAVRAEPALDRDRDLRSVPHRPLVSADDAARRRHPHQVADAQVAERVREDLLVAARDFVLNEDDRPVPRLPRVPSALRAGAVVPLRFRV